MSRSRWSDRSRERWPGERGVCRAASRAAPARPVRGRPDEPGEGGQRDDLVSAQPRVGDGHDDGAEQARADQVGPFGLVARQKLGDHQERYGQQQRAMDAAGEHGREREEQPVTDDEGVRERAAPPAGHGDRPGPQAEPRRRHHAGRHDAQRRGRQQKQREEEGPGAASREFGRRASARRGAHRSEAPGPAPIGCAARCMTPVSRRGRRFLRTNPGARERRSRKGSCPSAGGPL